MQDLNGKTTNGTVTSVEWNEIPSEIQRVIEDMGFTLETPVGVLLNLLAQAIAGMAAASDWYDDSGAADAYVLTPIAGKEGLSALDTEHDGAKVRFRADVNNAGASTVNVNGLGVKSILTQAAGALSGGEILAAGPDVELRYDFNGGTDRFFLRP